MHEIIPIDAELTNFSSYFDHNCRCILSARFGDGKSFFLNEVKKHLSDRYTFLTIYPINYQIAENKDIFEYIKRDILLQLLMTSEIELSEEKYGFFLRLWGFINQNKQDIISDIITLVTSTLTTIPCDIIEILKNNIQKFNKFSKQFDSQSNTIESYLDAFTKQPGSIYEFDPISQIIYQLITDIKEKGSKKVVLVIEDMDRIDPAHLFRILNVFSAHWDIQDYSEQKMEYGQPSNKYNFDKILLVCHFQNIKNIFHHFYGEKTDFTGYIHKFSPSLPYEYSLKNVLAEWLLNKLPFSQDKFPDICKKLVTLIMQRYENNEDIITNIRHITNFLTQSTYNIIDEKIPFYDFNNGINYCISTLNQVTQLLCILKNFHIPTSDFINSFPTDSNILYQQQLCQFIGHCWLIYPSLAESSNITFSNLHVNVIEESKTRLTFPNLVDGYILCQQNNVYFNLTCVVNTSPSHHVVPQYEIKDMLMDSVFSEAIKNNDWREFRSKQAYDIILSYFNQYV